tara:strand:+ start:17535 stop:18224 length:690 start_codon:yes stop_codon:yes gene_type:complete
MLRLFSRRRKPWARGYSHFNSFLDRFMASYESLNAASVNNHVIDLEAIGSYRVTRFIRDPRDMIVSGYHYHKQAREPWCSVTDPTEKDWITVNAPIPDGILPGESYSDMLQRVSLEEGLHAEMQFRRRHFESMMKWPTDDPDILVFKYEDIMGHEAEVFGKILAFYELPRRYQELGVKTAIKNSAARMLKKNVHIRNPEPNQWKKTFTDETLKRFEDLYPGLVDYTGYA